MPEGLQNNLLYSFLSFEFVAVRAKRGRKGSIFTNLVNEESDGAMEQSSDGDDEETEACANIRKTWNSLSPKVTNEEDLIGKFYAIIYESKKKQKLYVGRIVRRFLDDEGGNVDKLEILCLKPKVGSGTVLEDIPQNQRGVLEPSSSTKNDVVRYTDIVSLVNIIAGPLEVEALKGNKFNVPAYEEVRELFDTVAGLDRSVWLKYERIFSTDN